MYKSNTYKLFLLIFIFSAQTLLPNNNYRRVTFAQIKAEGKIWGVDLSHHQSDVNWEKLNTQKPYFIFFKATEGATHIDSKYKENYKNARKKKIIVGSYHFFSYTSNGRAQAEHFLQNVKLQKGDLPPVLDVEYKKNMPSRSVVTQEIIAFLKTVTTKTGKKPIIYCDYDYYTDYLKGKLKNPHILWVCDYRRKPDCEWTFWQTTDKFQLSGIRGNVDFNIFNGTKKQLKKILY
ncbi:MAG: GH25 family lysozyme [Paludibacter sp.]|nr:GH25 family lysozyme [Paludibacter sp.]